MFSFNKNTDKIHQLQMLCHFSQKGVYIVCTVKQRKNAMIWNHGVDDRLYAVCALFDFASFHDSFGVASDEVFFVGRDYHDFNLRIWCADYGFGAAHFCV